MRPARIFAAIVLALMLVEARMGAQQFYAISGTVTEDGTGAPVYMASIIDKEYGQWAMTDSQGKFVLPKLVAGPHSLTVSILGYEERTVKFDLDRNISGVRIVLKVESLALEEVVVTAKEGGEITTASKISKQTIEHVQPSSLVDVMQLLPGSVTANPSLTDASSLSIRDIGTNVANAAGTALFVDGASYSNDANMQVMTSGEGINSDQSNVASSAGSGIDARQVSTDNIESVEVIRGIPSVVYGDLTSGAVVVKTKAGVTPWELRVKMDSKLKQVFAGKGINLGNKAGVINFDADYALAFNDVRTQSSAYNRVNFQVGYSNNFNKKFTLNAKLRGNWSNATNASDPDLNLNEIRQEKDYGLRFNVNGKWIVNKPWLTNVDYLAAGSVSSQYSREKRYQSGAGYTPATAMMESGEALAFFTDPQYYSDVKVYGLPVDAQFKITANQFGKYGRVTNKALAGFEWKIQGNSGVGKVFSVDCPPSPGSASAYRERSYRDIPYMRRLTAYVEDNLKLPLASTVLELQAGARFNGMAVNGVNTSNLRGIEPRFNARYDIIKKKTGVVNELAVRAGWGKSFKMPSMIYLYPEPAYCDRVSFSYNDFSSNEYGLTVISTKKADTANEDLKLQRSTNFEAGIEFDFAGKLNGSVVYYNEKMINGYGFSTRYIPMPYTRYAYTWNGQSTSPVNVPSGAAPVYSNGSLTVEGVEVPSIVDTTFMSLSRPVNNAVNDKWGVEFTLDIAKIKAIHTAINISGAYMNMKSTTSGYTHKLYTGTVQGDRTYPYVGIYGGSSTMSTGSVRERLSTNLRFITHLPSLSMVVTITAQMVFMDRTRTISEVGGLALPYYYDEYGNRVSGREAMSDTEHTKSVNPMYIMGRDGVVIPFTREMETDPQYRNLILNTNTSTYYLQQGYPFYGMLNLRLSKEIRKMATVSFYANNFLNLRGRVENTVTRYPADKNTPIYFGAEIKITLK